MPYTYTLTTTILASAQEIYEAWLDSLAHSAMTGGEATMSDEMGAEVSAWDGYISGRNLELVPGERIVQSWRTSEFADEEEDSIVTVTLEEVDGGTLLRLEHSNVPDEQKSYEASGWRENYFEPMQAYFAERRSAAAETRPEAAPEVAPKPAAEAAPKAGRPRAVKRPLKVKRAVGAKSRRAPAVKASSGGKPTTRARRVARTASRKRAKPTRSKSGPGRRR